MEVPRLGVELELQLPSYTTATVAPDPSPVCDLYHSSQQCQILNQLREARDRTCKLMVPSQICFYCATTGTPFLNFWFQTSLFECEYLCSNLFVALPQLLILSTPRIAQPHPDPPASGQSYSQLHQKVWGDRPSAENSHALDQRWIPAHERNSLWFVCTLAQKNQTKVSLGIHNVAIRVSSRKQTTVVRLNRRNLIQGVC